MTDLTAAIDAAAKTCTCGKPATQHLKAENGDVRFSCPSHRGRADDWHDVTEACLHPQHVWAFGRCTVLTATENAIVDRLDALADEDGSPLRWLSPENEYYGIDGLHVWHIEELAQVVARVGETVLRRAFAEEAAKAIEAVSFPFAESFDKSPADYLAEAARRVREMGAEQ